MLMYSVRAKWKVLGGPGTIWKYFEALVRAAGGSASAKTKCPSLN
jgi:hypothetical protein